MLAGLGTKVYAVWHDMVIGLFLEYSSRDLFLAFVSQVCMYVCARVQYPTCVSMTSSYIRIHIFCDTHVDH